MNTLNILWIEEEADDTLVEFNTYFSLAGYLVKVVHSSTEAEEELSSGHYDLIILDIRIIPGDDEKWLDLHMGGERRLGLIVLRDIISKKDDLKDKTVIFTNENLSDIRKVLEECNFPAHKFLRKRDVKIPEQLEAFIKRFV